MLNQCPLNSLRSRRRFFAALCLAFALCGLLSSLHIKTAHAQQSTSEDRGISASGKGITGGALLGAELVSFVEALAGVKNTWAYIGGAAGGAIAGGIGGYYAEQANTPKYANYMLAGGMALLIPTTVFVLNSTSFSAPDHELDTSPPATETPTNPANPSSKEPETKVTVSPPRAAAPALTPTPKRASYTRRAPKHVTTSVVDVHDGSISVGVPVVQAVPLYSQRELQQFQLTQKTEIRVPVFEAAF